MRISTAIFIILSLLAMSGPRAALAFETDQYNLPPVPLADIGDEVSDHVEKALFAVLASLNSEISVRSKCLETRTQECRRADLERRKLAYLRSESTVAEMLYARLGKGSIFRSGLGRWIETHKFRTQPDRYKGPYSETIFVLKPSNYVTLSPTIRMYGSEFGIDKLDHFFQQGYEYYELKLKSLTAGATVAQAEKSAIAYGQKTERTFFGLLVSGVYSNADLYANYVGMKFYENLTNPIEIDGRVHPALASLLDGQWQFNTTALASRPLKSYISDHLNEAWNPSSFRFTLVRSVRREVKKHACPKWLKAFPDLTREKVREREDSLTLWHGVLYGHTEKQRTVRLADTCFGPKA